MNSSNLFKISRDTYFRNAFVTNVLKIPLYNSVVDAGNAPGRQGNIIIDRSTGSFCWHDGINWKCINETAGGAGDSPWEQQLETVAGSNLENVKLNTTTPYTSPNGGDLNNTENFLFGSDRIDSTGSSTGSDIFNSTRMYFLGSGLNDDSPPGPIGAFRAGITNGTEWNISNVGIGSVAFGRANTASNDYTAIGGGETNTAIDVYCAISGGRNNTCRGRASVIGGGESNNVSVGRSSTIGGGLTNITVGDVTTVGGGSQNLASGTGSTVGGGLNNQADNNTATVGGGSQNLATGSASTVGGGNNNQASNNSTTIAGGQSNISNGINSTIGGGINNISGNNNTTVAGGQSNISTGISSTVGGGLFNQALTFAVTVAGGSLNVANGVASTISGGRDNFTDTENSKIPGGRFATARSFGQHTHSNGLLSGTVFNSQVSEYIVQSNVVGPANAVLTADGGAVVITTNTINVPAEAVWKYELEIVARRTDILPSSDIYSEVYCGMINNTNGTLTAYGPTTSCYFTNGAGSGIASGSLIVDVSGVSYVEFQLPVPAGTWSVVAVIKTVELNI